MLTLLRSALPRHAAAAAALCLALAACSDGSSTSDATAAGGGERLELRHDTGTLALDAVPERVVTTSDETTELAVALGLQPVGVGSTRVSGATDEERFARYYIPAERLGDPAYVGGEELDLEAVAALEPDLVLHGVDDEVADALAGIAPTAVLDVQEPGAWQEAVVALGGATGRQERAERLVEDYEALVLRAREDLAAVATRYPRVGVLYPQYRGGSDNYLFTAEFALASVVPELGFALAGSPRASEAFPGVLSISSELYATIDADLVLALGTVPWQRTTSAGVLEALEAPVVGVPLDEGQPSAGPLTSPELVEAYRAVLAPLA